VKCPRLITKFEDETIVELATYINNIVIRLKAVEREDMLHVFGELLSAVFRAMPAKCSVSIPC
jgi:hypothetical protein